ncbi:hypothetical protein TRFO_21561 [Tritrichomonas foetus]|uniref:UBFD1 PH-like C-terminal domain-containing protein n=1 Tax=Tritrichomonas foetus TaxID=1144522 RepID=A0A1J4KE98_9EUKA|nr:hypothetical protein TRFO_21561 [Tritrichomonas foetus]|eukprot:OHT09515.1 hypothetical protein TRFO_21561 [Tritrichomonas foetus]
MMMNMFEFFKPKEEIFDKSIIAQGPPTIRFNYEARKQETVLPRNPFKVYDLQGTLCKLYFETDGIFIKYKLPEGPQKYNPENQDERIFYSEIRNFKLIPVQGYERFYMNLVMNTKFGKRILYYLPKEYMNLITKILREEE